MKIRTYYRKMLIEVRSEESHRAPSANPERMAQIHESNNAHFYSSIVKADKLRFADPAIGKQRRWRWPEGSSPVPRGSRRVFCPHLPSPSSRSYCLTVFGSPPVISPYRRNYINPSKVCGFRNFLLVKLIYLLVALKTHTPDNGISRGGPGWAGRQDSASTVLRMSVCPCTQPCSWGVGDDRGARPCGELQVELLLQI